LIGEREKKKSGPSYTPWEEGKRGERGKSLSDLH